MKKIAAAAAAALAVSVAVPLMVALMVTALFAPAADEELRAVACDGAIPATGSWRPPFQQPYTVSGRGFGRQFHPIHREWRMHTGQDLVSQPGPGPVVAAAAGTVTHAGPMGGYGNVVDVAHDGGAATRYAHLASIDAQVTPGAQVWTGQQLGVEGSTGTSTGNHLHFEVLLDGDPVDPVPFMLERGAPLNGQAVAPSPPPTAGPVPGPGPAPAGAQVEGGVGFGLPPPGEPRKASLTNPPLPIPPNVQGYYAAAAAAYQVPWTLLAGIGMAETGHGRATGTSSAGARGLMQFMPATWAAMGVDGDGDGRADITNNADSVFSAANYLTRSGVTTGPDGVRGALFAYNHADWYVNDVLHYAHAYGGGTVLGDPTDCGTGAAAGDPALPPLTDERAAAVLAWAASHVGEPYVFGANGPHAWDCSSFVRGAYAQIGISAPRTARAQRDWLAAGNGYRVQLGQERPGDLLFWDSYLGPNVVGHVAIVWDPATRTTVDARSTSLGVGHFTYSPDHHLFEIWRVGNVADIPSSTRLTADGATRPFGVTGKKEEAGATPAAEQRGSQPGERRRVSLAGRRGRMQRSRRHDPYPLTWEIPLAVVAAVVLAAVAGVHLGRAAANLLAGAGWALPARVDLFSTLPAVLRGDAAAGLPALAGPAAEPATLWACIAATELALLIAMGAATKAGLDRWGPHRLQGMATRADAEAMLGLTRLRRARAVVRPDLYGKGRAREQEQP